MPNGSASSAAGQMRGPIGTRSYSWPWSAGMYGSVATHEMSVVRIRCTTRNAVTLSRRHR